VSDAGRVISGRAAGRRLLAPGPGTRPLSDRVKQTLFAILERDLPGAVFLDLFAGSGAAGIEALSRGAARAIFVERDPGAIRMIEENLRRTSLAAAERVTVVRSDVLGWLAERARGAGPFDVVFVDPPYDDAPALGHVLDRLGRPDAGLLSPGARVVVKHFWRDRPAERSGLLASERERRFGETTLTFYLLDAVEDSGADAPPEVTEEGNR
jgi:16S rRNA (guanine966-N2)-methyltransferase